MTIMRKWKWRGVGQLRMQDYPQVGLMLTCACVHCRMLFGGSRWGVACTTYSLSLMRHLKAFWRAFNCRRYWSSSRTGCSATRREYCSRVKRCVPSLLTPVSCYISYCRCASLDLCLSLVLYTPLVLDSVLWLTLIHAHIHYVFTPSFGPCYTQ